MDVSLNVWFQSLGMWLRPLMVFFSELGTERFYMLVMPLFFWCVDVGLGLRLAVLLLLGNAVNVYLKLAFHMPRPFWISEQVRALAVETSFGMPSGHAQSAASLWGLAAVAIKKNVLRWCLAFLIMMIGLSRIYLGVHFVGDVLVGWLVGALLLGLFLRLESPVIGFWRRLSFWQKLLVALGSSLAMLGLGWVIRSALSGWTLPEAWVRVARTNANLESLDPLSLEGLVTVAGTWAGAVAGIGIYGQYFGEYNLRGSLSRRLWHYGVGLVGVLLLYVGLGQAFALFEGDVLALVLRYLRYALIGVWVTWGAPALFRII